MEIGNIVEDISMFWIYLESCFLNYYNFLFISSLVIILSIPSEWVAIANYLQNYVKPNIQFHSYILETN